MGVHPMLYLGQVRCCVWVSSGGRVRVRVRVRVEVRVRVRGVKGTHIMWMHPLDVLGGQDDLN